MVSSAPQDNDILLADLAKEVFASGKGNGSPLTLGLLQRSFKKVPFATPSRSGCKKDQEKIRLTGDLLVEFGIVKAMDAHFPHSSQ